MTYGPATDSDLNAALSAPSQLLNATYDIPYAAQLIERVCALAGSMDFLREIETYVQDAKIDVAVTSHNTPVIFDWLLTTFSYQGISDRVAARISRRMVRHLGRPWLRLLSLHPYPLVVAYAAIGITKAVATIRAAIRAPTQSLSTIAWFHARGCVTVGSIRRR